jgi:hypothetical protein
VPKITTKNTEFIIYADDISTLVTNPSPNDFKINLNKVFVDMNKWFKFLVCPSRCVYINVLDLFITVDTINNWL